MFPVYFENELAHAILSTSRCSENISTIVSFLEDLQRNGRPIPSLFDLIYSVLDFAKDKSAGFLMPPTRHFRCHVALKEIEIYVISMLDYFANFLLRADA